MISLFISLFIFQVLLHGFLPVHSRELRLPTVDLKSEQDASCSPTSDIAQYQTLHTYVEPLPPSDPVRASIFRYRQQQSVNLGSWFVQEQWMVPSVFQCAAGPRKSEIDVANGRNARAILEKHWDTFITQSDFNYLASIGINTVRLPIGYWSLGPSFCEDTPFANVSSVYQHAWAQVVRAINMASEAGIGVLVDLHGAPGSQNGQPHSGISDGKTNLFTDPKNQDKTMQVLKYLAQQLSPVPNVVGIQILNEPQDCPELTAFYTRAISAMRDVCSQRDFPLYVHDGFDFDRFNAYVSKRKDFVVQDHHSYFVYTPEDDAESAAQHTSDVRSKVAAQLADKSNSTLPHNIIIGEWSCALTPDSLRNEDPNKARRDFCMAQLETYTQNTPGWSFWSYKTENCDSNPDWCFRKVVGEELPSTFFSYGPIPITTKQQRLIDLLDPEASTHSNSDLIHRSDIWSPHDSPLYRHRSRSISHRRQQSTQDHASDDAHRALSSESEGYWDGFTAAQRFAAFGGSKLGFSVQYIWDNIPASWIETERVNYSRGFMYGLSCGEKAISSVLGNF